MSDNKTGENITQQYGLLTYDIWDSEKEYKQYDRVASDGSIFSAKKNNVNSYPGTDEESYENWELIGGLPVEVDPNDTMGEDWENYINSPYVPAYSSVINGDQIILSFVPLDYATNEDAGIIKVGDGLSVNDGVLSVKTSSNLKAGKGIGIDDNAINILVANNGGIDIEYYEKTNTYAFGIRSSNNSITANGSTIDVNNNIVYTNDPKVFNWEVEDNDYVILEKSVSANMMFAFYFAFTNDFVLDSSSTLQWKINTGKVIANGKPFFHRYDTSSNARLVNWTNSENMNIILPVTASFNSSQQEITFTMTNNTSSTIDFSKEQVYFKYEYIGGGNY